MFNSLKLNTRFAAAAFGAVAIGATAFSAPAAAAPLPLFPFFLPQIEAAPPPVQAVPREEEERSVELPARLRRQVVNYYTREAPGTIIIDTPNTYLYLVLGNGQAMRYGIGIGRDGFTWSGVQTITRKAEWPAWTPPPEMTASLICRATWPAAPATRSAPARCISAAPSIASTAPTTPRRSAPVFPQAASASPMKTSRTSIRASASAPR
jgi:hypothetical protein